MDPELDGQALQALEKLIEQWERVVDSTEIGSAEHEEADQELQRVKHERQELLDENQSSE